jgi:hypothetical protein
MKFLRNPFIYLGVDFQNCHVVFWLKQNALDFEPAHYRFPHVYLICGLCAARNSVCNRSLIWLGPFRHHVVARQNANGRLLNDKADSCHFGLVTLYTQYCKLALKEILKGLGLGAKKRGIV